MFISNCASSNFILASKSLQFEQSPFLEDPPEYIGGVEGPREKVGADEIQKLRMRCVFDFKVQFFDKKKRDNAKMEYKSFSIHKKGHGSTQQGNGLGEASCCRLKDQELEIPHCQGQCLRCGSLDEAKKEADYLFSEKVTQFKTLDTTSVASKSKIDEASASKAKDKVSNAFKKKKRNMRDPDILWVVDSGFQSICGSFTIKKLRFLKKFMGTVRLDTDNLQLFQAMVESSELGSKKTRLYCDVSTENYWSSTSIGRRYARISQVLEYHRVTGWDQPPLQIMQMLYCFVNNIHVDYAELMWEGIYYSLHHPATSIPYPRFTKIIISHYMTIFPDISRRARDAYHNLQDDDIMKNIFNSGRNKNKVGMRIPAWMITDEMKLTEHYKMYAEVFGLDVPLTQSQPTEFTQGTHRTPSVPRQIAQLTPPVLVPSAEKADEMILQDTDSSNPENVDDSSPPRHDDTSIPDTRLEPMSDKKGPEVEIVQEKEEETTMGQILMMMTHPAREGENSAKRQKTSEYEAYVSGESSSETIITQDIMEEISLTIDEAKLKKMANEMLRQRYKNFSLSLRIHEDHTITSKLLKSSDRSTLSLINLDLLFLSNGNSGPEKISIKKFNPYARLVLKTRESSFEIFLHKVKDRPEMFAEELMIASFGYVQKELSNDEVSFLVVFEEEIEVRLNYRDQNEKMGDIMPQDEKPKSAGRGLLPCVHHLARGELVKRVSRGGRGAMGGAPNFPMIYCLDHLRNSLPPWERWECDSEWQPGVVESVHDMSGCSIDQKVKYIAGLFLGMSWNEFKFMMIQEFCPSHEMQKLEFELWNHAMVRAGHAAYTDRFHELVRLVPHLVTPESRMIERYVYGLALQTRKIVAAMEPKTIQKAVQISSALTDEAVRNGSIKKAEKRGNMGEPSKDRSGRDDNKSTRIANAFATTINPVGRENTGTWPKCTTCISYHAPGGPCRTCFNYNHPSYLAKDCRGVPRNVNPVNARNPTVMACYECGSTNHVSQLVLDGIGYKDQEETVQTKLLLITRVRVVETKGTRLGVGHSCWEQRKLARIRTL
ncbi:reverse transcriptase domain-containing protein [Tanacetum coccineum]